MAIQILQDAAGNTEFVIGAKFEADFIIFENNVLTTVTLATATITSRWVDTLSKDEVLAAMTLTVINDTTKIVRLSMTAVETALIPEAGIYLADIKVVPAGAPDDETNHGIYQVTFRDAFTP